MQTVDSINLSAANQDSFQDLLIAIEAGQGDLNLLLAICDDNKYREFLINNYEQFLQTMGIRSYRVQLNSEDPSIYQALANLYHSESYLQHQEKSVVTVLGTTDLLPLKLGEKRSQLEIFCGYLQYTREGLREFPFPVVLWLTNFIHDQIAEKANDFYSWRRGVFFFTPEPSFQGNITSGDKIKITNFTQGKELSFADIEQQNIETLKIEDLQALIEQKQGNPDQNLATLYSSLGLAYKQKLDSGQSTDYQADLKVAISALQKAIELQSSLNLEVDLAVSLHNLAYFYELQGQYEKAKPLLLSSIAIQEKQIEKRYYPVAANLNNLAYLYKAQGKYEEAEALYLRSLAIIEEQLGKEHPYVATSLNNLADLYQSQSKYGKAETLYLRSLAIVEEQLGEEHLDLASNLNNLASLYQTQGKYVEAEALYVRSLAIVEKQLGENHPHVATILNNLAILYHYQKKYEKAESLYLRSLIIRKKNLGENHSDVAQSFNNLARLYHFQKKYSEAASLYQRAIAIATQIFGQEHPNTQTISNNYLKMLNEESNQYSSKN